MIEKLAHGDITKFEEIGNQNLIGCLNLLAYWQTIDNYKKAKLQEYERNKQVTHGRH